MRAGGHADEEEDRDPLDDVHPGEALRPAQRKTAAVITTFESETGSIIFHTTKALSGDSALPGSPEGVARPGSQSMT